MSCYAPHPTEKNSKGEPLTCRHGEGHRGDHGSERWAWANEADPLRRQLAAAVALLRRWVRWDIDGVPGEHPLLESEVFLGTVIGEGAHRPPRSRETPDLSTRSTDVNPIGGCQPARGGQ